MVAQSMNDWAIEETVRGLFWLPDRGRPSLADIRQEFVRGLFWSPNRSHEDAIPGTLSLTSDGGATLDLFGIEQESYATGQQTALIPHRRARFSWEQKSRHRIVGIAEELGLVTLNRCVAAGWQTSLQVRLGRASYRVETIFQGLHYKAGEESSPRRLGFYATGLEQMLRGLDVQEATLHDGCRLRLVPTSGTQVAHAEILPESPTGLVRLTRHAVTVRDFLSFARMRQSAIYAMWATEHDAPAEHDVVNVRVPIPWNTPSISRRFISPDAMLFATGDVNGSLAETISRWVRLCADYEDAVALYFSDRYLTNAPLHVKLSTLFRAVDAWYRVDYKVPETVYTPAVAEALENLIGKYTADLGISFSTLSEPERVREMRNGITHPGRTTPLSDGSPLEYAATERQLILLLQICMLREIGFSDDDVKRIVRKDGVRQLLQTEFIKFV